MLLHTGALRYKYFYAEMILLTQVPLHRDACTRVFLHVNTSTVHSAFRTHSFTLRFLYTQTLFTESFWHTVAGTFTCKYLCTAVFILRACSLHARMLCHTDAFDHTCFYTEIFLHGDTVAQRECFFTQILLQRDDFTLSNFTQKPKQAEVLLQKNACARRVFSYGIFTQTYYIIILNYFLWRTRAWRKEFSTHMQNHSFTTAFDGRDAFPGKGLAQDKPTLQFYLNVWRSTFCVNGSRFVDINPPCPAARREKLETIKGVGVCKKLISTCVFTPATSHLHISTSHFQTTISACIYIYLPHYTCIWHIFVW